MKTIQLLNRSIFIRVHPWSAFYCLSIVYFHLAFSLEHRLRAPGHVEVPAVAPFDDEGAPEKMHHDRIVGAPVQHRSDHRRGRPGPAGERLPDPALPDPHAEAVPVAHPDEFRVARVL